MKTLAEKIILWTLAVISPAGLIALGVAYGEQTTTLSRVVKDVDSLSVISAQMHRDDERIKGLTVQQTEMRSEQKEQRDLLLQILTTVKKNEN